MGLRKLGEDTKVTKMKMVPTSEKQEATRSVISRALDSRAVNPAMAADKIGESDRCSFPRRAATCIAAQRKCWLIRAKEG